MKEVYEISPAFVFVGGMLSMVQRMSSREFLRFIGLTDERQIDTIEQDDPVQLPMREGISPGWLFELTSSRHNHRPYENKALTLRSYRNPQAIGGDCRKASARKLERRLTARRADGRALPAL